MAKRTAIIDLGSNSIRLVIFEKTSRYAFGTHSEYKHKVRIGENAYNNGKILQDEAMQRASTALAHFKAIIQKEKCSKTLIVGTSALRDAPNSKFFIKKIQKELGLNIKCIDGKTESYLGGLAALNLLSNVKNATTLDIGGGSSELCLIKNSKIVDTISLDVGTVRLKELFSDKNKKDMHIFLEPILRLIPKEFHNDKLITIGGSLRAISNSIMQKNSYPLKSLHDFHYELKDELKHIEKILYAKPCELFNYGIKKDRLDTIQEGALIFLEVAKTLGSKSIITSGVGVREGVYLNDILPASKNFPVAFNPSIRFLQDRFLSKEKSNLANYAGKLFESLQSLHKLDKNFKFKLINAAKLSHIGRYLNFYYANDHSVYFILNALIYKLSHKEKVLLACLIKASGKRLNPSLVESFKKLLPAMQDFTWLNFMLALSKFLEQNHFKQEKLHFTLKEKTLYIYTHSNIDIQKDELKKIILPEGLRLLFNQKPFS